MPQAWQAAAQADIVVLVVSAQVGECETGLAKGGQTREHALIAKSVCPSNVIVAVNKMDTKGETKWSNLRYEEVRAQVWAALKTSGYHDDQVTFVPISAATGDNLGDVDRGSAQEEEGGVSSYAPWYSGSALLEVLEAAPLPARDAQGPLRILVSGREKGSSAATALTGCVEQGTVEVGSPVALVGGGGGSGSATAAVTEGGVQAVQVGGREVRCARAGEFVRLRLLGTCAQDVMAGHALCGPEQPLLRSAAKFKAQVRLVETLEETPVITPGFRCVLHLHMVTEECEVAKLIEAVDPRTKKKEQSPKFVRAPMVTLCVLALTGAAGREEVPVDPGAGRLARFILRNDGGTIGAGKVAELPKPK